MSSKLNDLPWQPAAYEHKATLIGRSPLEVSRSPDLMVEAVLREFETYAADYVTVGLDVYNVEAEALGAKVVVPEANACPDLAGPLFNLEDIPEHPALPDIPIAGRFALFLEAGLRVRKELEGRTRVRVAASGPVTLAVKLTNLEDVILSLCMEDGHAERLLAFTTELCEAWVACLRAHELDAIVFDSMAAPPMLSPALYDHFVLPLHQRIMNRLMESGQQERELVIGGNTTPLAASLARTGATILLCDYAADADAFSTALGDDQATVVIRRNIAPSSLLLPDINPVLDAFARDLARFRRPMAGTGILPYDFPPDNLLRFRDRLSERYSALHVQKESFSNP